MRTIIFATLACLVSMVVTANPGFENEDTKVEDEATTNTSPVASDRNAESQSEDAWATLTERVPDLGGISQTTAAQDVPHARTVAPAKRHCVKYARIGTRLKKRICYTEEQWLALHVNDRARREAIFQHGMSH